MLEKLRSLEEAADELGRLDSACAFAPPAVSVALRIAVVAELTALETDPGSPGTTLPALAAAEGDALHDAELPTTTLHWRDLIRTEERRVRGGAPLSAQRFAVVAPTLSTYTDRARLEAIWRESGLTRPVLLRALDAAAWSPTPALGAASAALMLCAGGRADRVRALPFAGVAPEAREAAILAWRQGDDASWTSLGLEAAARHARATRVAVERAIGALGEESARLDALGRAAITARRALGVLRARFVTTMPSLAEELELSRPAASDALDRLVAAQLAREVTGRARDRVYAWAAGCAVAEARPAS